ncbi:acyltransferase family protein [Achromobacter aloeverae]
MGLLRTLFALSVVLDHSPFNQGHVLVGGRLAVQLFYVISGFLISYILNANDTYRSAGRFYTNRILRIYPMYIVVALIALVTNLAIHPAFMEVYDRSPPLADLCLMLANVFIVGQDWIMFAGIKNGLLAWTGAYTNSDVPLYDGLLVPQAWTLGVELTFYLIAPFILRSLRTVLLLFLASLALRVVLLGMGIAQSDPWSYRFFPLELALFLAGALSHRLLLPLFTRLSRRLRFLPELATGLFVLYTLFHFSVPLNHNARDALVLMIFATFLPLAFIFQSRYRLDKKIGQLSYPIYICHAVVMLLVGQMTALLGITDALAISGLNVLLSIAAAWLLYQAIDHRIERLRQRVKTDSPAPSDAAADALRA